MAQLNLPPSYTGVELKGDMIEWIKKNNNLAQVVTHFLSTVACNCVCMLRTGSSNIMCFILGGAWDKPESSKQHVLRGILQCRQTVSLSRQRLNAHHAVMYVEDGDLCHPP